MYKKYVTVETLETLEIETSSRKVIAMLEMQARELDNGNTGRAYPIIKYNIGGRDIFLHVDVATALLSHLADLVPKAKSVQVQLNKEADARRKEWEEKISNPGERQRQVRTGKTERDKAKDNYLPPDKKKARKSEESRQVRSTMQGRKGG